MPVIEIQGIIASYREQKPDEDVLFSIYEKEDQYFRKTKNPFTDDDLVEIAQKEFKYSAMQKSWLEEEEWRIDRGVYCSINGVLTYIPGSYYGYLNYWTLEHGESPDYREVDRIFFLLKEFLYNHPTVLGITRGKGRRQGATSIGSYWQWWICARKAESIGGIISFSDDAASAVFQRMFMRGFKNMLPCFVADFDSDSDNFIRFVKPVDKKKKGVPVKREGLNSYIGYKPTTINSYDSGRLTYGLFDESGKYERMDVNTYWSKVSPTFMKGRYKLGFAYMPTTVNPRNKGGENFKKFWENSNQNAINPTTDEKFGLDTPNRVVRFFISATEGYAGCIDKFGNSVIEDPKEPIMGNDGRWITEGSMTVILRERAKMQGEQLMEHRRDFPLDEYDMFSFTTGNCEFNEENIRVQLQYLENNRSKYFLRQVRLYWEQGLEIDPLLNINRFKDVVKFADDPKGDWLLYEIPKKENNFNITGGHFEPLGFFDYGIGVDTFKGGFSVNGSQGTICVGKNSTLVNGKEEGMYPVLFYVGRPRLVQHFYEEVRKACFWYGCRVNFEIDAGDYYYGYFEEKNALRFLEWCPAINPNKKHPLIKPGTESADPFQLAAQLEAGKIYVDGTGIDHYNGHVHRIPYPHLLNQLLEYNHEERTPYDSCIALFMWLLPTLKRTRPQQIAKYYKPLIKTFKLNV